MTDEKQQPDSGIDDQALADEWAAALEEAGTAGQDDIDALLNDVEPPPPAAKAAKPNAVPMPMEDFPSGASKFEQPMPKIMEGPNLEVILDIPVTISMEVGSTEINIRNLLQLNQGSIIELDRMAGEALDVLVNGTLIAHGEVVVVNEKFGIRLTDVVSPSERIRKLR